MTTLMSRNRGFTLIELMVAIAVLSILLVMAIPSFNEFRQRTAIRGASEQALSFWNNARLEAAKRNTWVKVGVHVDGDDFCLGAAETANSTDTTPCNCLQAPSVVSNACTVARFPVDQDEWRGVTLSNTSTLGPAGSIVVVLEPKRGGLITPADLGVIALNGPAGTKSYRLNLHVDALGRGVLCESTAAGLDDLPGYGARQCAP